MDGLTQFGTLAALAARTAPDRVRAAVTTRLTGAATPDAEGWWRFVTWLLHMPISESSPAARELCRTIAINCDSALRLMAIERLVHVWGDVDSAQAALAHCEPGERVQVLERCWRVPSARALCRQAFNDRQLWNNREEVDHVLFAARGWANEPEVRELVSDYLLAPWDPNQRYEFEFDDSVFNLSGPPENDSERTARESRNVPVARWRDRMKNLVKVADVLSESPPGPELIKLLADHLGYLVGRDAIYYWFDQVSNDCIKRIGAWEFAPDVWRKLIDYYEKYKYSHNYKIALLFAYWVTDSSARRVVLQHFRAARYQSLSPEVGGGLILPVLIGWSDHAEARADYVRFIHERVRVSYCGIRGVFEFVMVLLNWSPESDTDELLKEYVESEIKAGQGVIRPWLFKNAARHQAVVHMLKKVLVNYRTCRYAKFLPDFAPSVGDRSWQRDGFLVRDCDRPSSPNHVVFWSPRRSEFLWGLGDILDSTFGPDLVDVVHTLVAHLAPEDGAEYLYSLDFFNPLHRAAIVECVRKNPAVEQLLADPSCDPRVRLILNLKFGERTWSEETRTVVTKLLDECMSSGDAMLFLASFAAEVPQLLHDRLTKVTEWDKYDAEAIAIRLCAAATSPNVEACLVHLLTDQAGAPSFGRYFWRKMRLITAVPPQSHLFDRIWAATFTQLARMHEGDDEDEDSTICTEWYRYPYRRHEFDHRSEIEKRLDERDGFRTNDEDNGK